MSAVWMSLPSAKPDGGTIPLWKAKGYNVAVWRDPGKPTLFATDLVIEAPYLGYYAACNRLVRDVFEWHSDCDWCVCAADDTLPDERNPEEIAAECQIHSRICSLDLYRSMLVMQPTGDPWADGLGRIIERIAGSPWIGREFARWAYQGKGPYCEEYFHMGGDEELKCVAENLGVYWARPDLTHFHQWFGRDGDQHQGVTVPIPAYMARAYGPEEWAHFQRVFTERKAAGFPGSELL